ncbi:MAG: outer membrane beta-barrel protein [Opitutaceae bacterium]
MRFPLAGVTALLTALPALAEIKINENLGVSGYVVGSARYGKADPGDNNSTLDIDAYKLAASAYFKPVTGTVSFFGFSSGDPVLLDAYATYDFGGGTTLTAGKFLSWLGYEAFDWTNMTQISYGWEGSPGAANIASPNIPAYHSGVKLENSGDGYSMGIAFLDSLYGPTYYKGDGDLDNGVGAEVYYTYKGAATTAFFSLAAQTDDDTDTDVFTADVWLQHVIGDTTLAAEYSWSSFDTASGKKEPYFWLLFIKQAFSPKVALVGRIAGGEVLSGEEFTKFTFAPLFTVTPNLEVSTEYSFTDYKNHSADKGHFLGAQMRFKF